MYMFFVRHGQTEWNQLGLVQGRADNSLNETGIEQARTTAEAFRGKTFEAVITSPLIRTKQTAEYLCEFADVKSVIEDNRIIEKDFGICEGRLIKERWGSYPNGHAPGEESFKIVRKRMREAVCDYVKTYQNDILVVTHGCAIAALVKELDPYYDAKFVRLKNTSITIIDHRLEVIALDLVTAELKTWFMNH